MTALAEAPQLADFEEAVRHASESAKRVHGTAFYARAHEHLNRRLDELEAFKATQQTNLGV